MSAAGMDTQTAARIVLAEYRRLERSAQRKPLEKVLDGLADADNRVFQELVPDDRTIYYQVTKSWTAKGLGTALALDQLLDFLCQESGEDL